MSSSTDPSQPFPSPGSSFVPPPVPGLHEFATRSSSLPRKMSKRDIDDLFPNVRASTTCNGSTTFTPTVTTTTTTTTNGAALSSSSTSPIGVDSSAPDPSLVLPPTPPSYDPPDVPPHQPPYDSTSASDPPPLTPSSHHTRHKLGSLSVTSLTSSRPAPPSPAVSRRASGLSRASSRPVSGLSSSASSRPPSGTHYVRPVPGGGSSRPASGTVGPIVPTPTTTTLTTSIPSYLRHSHDRLSNLAPTISTSDPDPFVAEPTPAPTPAATTTMPALELIQIRDYGFALTDPRFTGHGPHVPRANRPAVLARRLASPSGSTPTSSSDGDNGNDDEWEDDDDEGEAGRMDIDKVQRMWEDVVDDGTNGWSGFKWGLGRAWGFGRASGVAAGPGGTTSATEFPSRGDLDRNFGGEDEYEDMEIDEDGEAFSDEDGLGDADGVELPLLPGVYRALYAFEPEGTAETKLDEDQLVRVIGRGGGVGWAVVVKDGLKDTGIHALVPESYLELVRLGGEENA